MDLFWRETCVMRKTWMDVMMNECSSLPSHHRHFQSQVSHFQEIPVVFGWRSLLLGWRPSLVGWRPSLLGWRPSLLGWRPSLLGWRPSLVGQRPSLLRRVFVPPSTQYMVTRPAASQSHAERRAEDQLIRFRVTHVHFPEETDDTKIEQVLDGFVGSKGLE